MPHFRIYTVTAVFNDGSYAQVDINCSNSIEAIKSLLSTNNVIQKMDPNHIAGRGRRDIIRVECTLKEFKA